VIVVGGELRRLSQTLVGPLSRPVLDSLHVDLAFMGTIGLDAEAGLTTTDPAEAFTKEQVLRRAGRVILLADRAKLGQVSFVRAGRLEQVDVLVTDRGIDAAWRRALRRANVDLVEA
jgi:DeoR/GlpR family transcriptional regulator of sugar metabolism